MTEAMDGFLEILFGIIGEMLIAVFGDAQVSQAFFWSVILFVCGIISLALFLV